MGLSSSVASGASASSASVASSASASSESGSSASSESGSSASSGSGSSASSGSGSSASPKSSSSSSVWDNTLNQTSPDLVWYKTIEKKLEKCGLIKDKMNESDRKKLIISLGEKRFFKEKYLTLNKDYNENILQKLNEEITLMDDLPESLKQDITDDEKSKYIDRILEYRRDAKRFDVRMFLSKLSRLRPHKLLFFSEYGTVHAGLEIDGVTIEWGCESLVLPNINTRRMLIYARVNFEKMFPDTVWGNVKALVRHPLDYIANVYQMIYDRILAIGHITQDKLDKIESVCIHYNRNITYNVFNKNCQTFMKNILDAIGLKFEPEGEFKKFMDRITSGEEEIGKFQYISAVFQSRNEFDHYVDQHWHSTSNQWNKKVLICYSDMMDDMYKQGDKKWGPIDDESKWAERIESVA
ncbi:unnamed protein product [Didymodactylos carnosus]|uniref:PPPDE domain-containing protein n=1 Tax=Didymodactylos carnosus TaxID=1234261 RepID=A0A815K5N1_9BILA|nr:unnamed protein product [Didymodactylos carnosus]CAF1391210.1 unnamed protein product [Didymodactylos carnosus]CAF4019471.1 unnamed protein product [Didymodactylos carnosus]CAF4285763.1 unnamed protein product [Didymodactylos carnosus]